MCRPLPTWRSSITTKRLMSCRWNPRRSNWWARSFKRWDTRWCRPMAAGWVATRRSCLRPIPRSPCRTAARIRNSRSMAPIGAAPTIARMVPQSAGERLNRDRGLDAGMGLVILQGEILVLESEDVLHRRIQFHGGERIGLARQLLFRLGDVIEIEMRIAQTVHEFAGLKTDHLRHHQGEKRV